MHMDRIGSPACAYAKLQIKAISRTSWQQSHIATDHAFDDWHNPTSVLPQLSERVGYKFSNYPALAREPL